MAHGTNAYNYLIVFAGTLGSFTFGYTNAAVGSILGQSGLVSSGKCLCMLLTLMEGLPLFLEYFGLALVSDSNRVQRIVGGMRISKAYESCVSDATQPRMDSFSEED